MMDKSDDNLNSLMDKFQFGRFTGAEQHFVEDYVAVFDPFVRALNVFQGDTFIGVLLPILTKLKKDLQYHSLHSRSCKALADALIKGIDSRFSADFANDNFYIAAGESQYNIIA